MRYGVKLTSYHIKSVSNSLYQTVEPYLWLLLKESSKSGSKCLGFPFQIKKAKNGKPLRWCWMGCMKSEWNVFMKRNHPKGGAFSENLCLHITTKWWRRKVKIMLLWNSQNFMNSLPLHSLHIYTAFIFPIDWVLSSTDEIIEMQTSKLNDRVKGSSFNDFFLLCTLGLLWRHLFGKGD